MFQLQFEGYPVSWRYLPSVLMRRSFYKHYFHKWVLCKLDTAHEYYVPTNMPVRMCRYCSQIVKVLGSKEVEQAKNNAV